MLSPIHNSSDDHVEESSSHESELASGESDPSEVSLPQWVNFL